MEFTNLCYVVKNGKVLLIHKKRGLGAGNLNAPGGHIDPGENPEQSAIREVEEELKIKVEGLQFHGILEFINNDVLDQHCYVFTASDFEGEPQETEEAIPFWVDKNNLPFDRMWEDDKFWLPAVLEGKIVLGRFWFKNWKSVKHQLWVFDEKHA